MSNQTNQNIPSEKEMLEALEQLRTKRFAEEIFKRSQEELPTEDITPTATRAKTPFSIANINIYAMAASLIGVMAIGTWYFVNQKDTPHRDTFVKNQNPTVSDSTANSKGAETTVAPQNSKEISQTVATKDSKIKPLVLDKTALAFEVFYKDQKKSINTELMGDGTNGLKTAKLNLVENNFEAAMATLEKIKTQDPNDDDVNLYLALCYYKKNRIEEAIALLKLVKENEEVSDFLKEIGGR
jgi:tetratricopeptide (TPR) repeat protein